MHNKTQLTKKDTNGFVFKLEDGTCMLAMLNESNAYPITDAEGIYASMNPYQFMLVNVIITNDSTAYASGPEQTSAVAIHDINMISIMEETILSIIRKGDMPVLINSILNDEEIEGTI